MVDWVLDVLVSGSALISRTSVSEMIVLCSVTGLIGLPLLVLVHELGHAAAVLLRGLPLESIVVGNADDLTFRVGAVVVRVGRVLEGAGPGDFVEFEAKRASANDLLVIALAGPLANLVVAPLLAVLALASSGGALDASLWLLSAGSVVMGVRNLIPRGMPGTTDAISDGRFVQLAWSRRGRPVTGSGDLPPVPPEPSPASEPPSPEPGSGFRWPFVTALLLVAGGTLAMGDVMLLLLIVVVFGVALLMRAHRGKVW
jgi:hypothetical protein